MSDYNSSATISDNQAILVEHIKLFNNFLADKLTDKERKLVVQRLNKYGKIDSEITHIAYIQQLSNQVQTMISASTENIESLNKLKNQLKALKKDSESSPIKKTQYDKSLSDFNKIKNSYEILTYDQINELLIELEKSIIRTIPYKLSPVFLLGRVTQQLLITAGNLEEQCLDEESDEYVVTEDALIDCESSFEVVSGLINTTLVQAKNIRLQLKDEIIKTNESESDNNENTEESDNNEQESNEDESDNQDENYSSDEDTKKQSESSESSDGDHSD
jgi:hypothetical protein